MVEAEVEQLGEFVGLVAQAGQVVERRRRRRGSGNFTGGRHAGRWASAQTGLAVVGYRAVVPADDRVHGDQPGMRRIAADDREQRRRPGEADRVAQRRAGRPDQWADALSSAITSWGSSDTSSPALTTLPSSATPQHVGRDTRPQMQRAGDGQPGGRHGGPGRDRDLTAVPAAEVAQQQVVGVEQGARLDPGAATATIPAVTRRPSASPVARAQAERRQHLGVQPHDAASRVERGRAQRGGERKRRRGHASA